jgi:hypothetical protein
MTGQPKLDGNSYSIKGEAIQTKIATITQSKTSKHVLSPDSRNHIEAHHLNSDPVRTGLDD